MQKMQKNKIIEPFVLKSKITDSIDREEILQCYSCSEKYDHKVRIPMIACLQCVDIVCFKCLNDKCQSYKAKGMFNKCNKCPKQMIPAQFKRCLPILNFLEIYQKIKSKETHYRQTCQALKDKLNQHESVQSFKKNKSVQNHMKIQIQRLNMIINKILKQKQESSKQLQKQHQANSKYLERIRALASQIQRLQTIIKNDENTKRVYGNQIQRLNTLLRQFHIKKQNQDKINYEQKSRSFQQINRLKQFLKQQNIKISILNSKIGELQSKLRTQKSQYDNIIRQMQGKVVKVQNKITNIPNKAEHEQLNYLQLIKKESPPFRKAVRIQSETENHKKFSMKHNKSFENGENQQVYLPLLEDTDVSFQPQKGRSTSKERRTKKIFYKPSKTQRT